MAITEIALLRLLPGVTTGNSSLQSKLSHAKKVMEEYTGRKFYYYQQTEDASCIYVFGEWDSLQQHMDEFIPGHENQSILNSLKDLLTVDWLLHIDTTHDKLPFPVADSNDNNGKFLSISRYFVTAGEDTNFSECFAAHEHHRNDFVTEGRPGGGWRVDKDGDREEWVAICPWKNIEQYRAFAASEACKNFLAVKEFTEATEVKHAEVMNL